MDDAIEVFADDVSDADVSDADESEVSGDGSDSLADSGDELAADAAEDENTESETSDVEVGGFGGQLWVGGNPFANASKTTSSLAGLREVYLPTPAQNQQTVKDYRAGLNNDTTKVIK